MPPPDWLPWAIAALVSIASAAGVTATIFVAQLRAGEVKSLMRKTAKISKELIVIRGRIDATKREGRDEEILRRLAHLSAQVEKRTSGAPPPTPIVVPAPSPSSQDCGKENLADEYNEGADAFCRKYDPVSVTRSKEGPDRLEPSETGYFLALRYEGKSYCMPRPFDRITSLVYSDVGLKNIFDCEGYREGFSHTYRLVEPAELDQKGNLWTIQRKGKLAVEPVVRQVNG